MKKTYFLIISLFAIALILIVIAFATTPKQKTPAAKSPTVSRTSTPTAGSAVPNNIPKKIPPNYPSHTLAISALIEKLPHEGNYFSLSYDFSKDSFMLLLNTTSSATGEAEFESFLKQNGVLDESWLQNLIRSYQ